MLSDAPAKLGDRLTVRDPRLAPDLGLTLTALLLLGLGDQRWDRSRLALVVERDEHEVRAGRVGLRARLELLGFHTDADLERGRPHVVHRRLHGHGIPYVDRLEERTLVP